MEASSTAMAVYDDDDDCLVLVVVSKRIIAINFRETRTVRVWSRSVLKRKNLKWSTKRQQEYVVYSCSFLPKNNRRDLKFFIKNEKFSKHEQFPENFGDSSFRIYRYKCKILQYITDDFCITCRCGWRQGAGACLFTMPRFYWGPTSVRPALCHRWSL